MEKEQVKYIASCVFSRDYPQLSKKVLTYMEQAGLPVMRCCFPSYKVREFEDAMAETIKADWCRLPHYIPVEDGDTIISVCHNCTNLIVETKPKAKVVSLYEWILADKKFIYPDYQGREMTIQDCWRAADHYEEKKAVRMLLEKMNIRAREIAEPEDFCGLSLLRPQPARNPKVAPKHYGPEKTVGKFGTYTLEEQKAIMLKHAEKIRTEEVVCYCHYCLKGLELSGKKSYHIVDLLFK